MKPDERLYQATREYRNEIDGVRRGVPSPAAYAELTAALIAQIEEDGHAADDVLARGVQLRIDRDNTSKEKT